MEGLYGGKYERIERVGNGAYGVIYKVRANSDGRLLIAKHIPLSQVEREKALQEVGVGPLSSRSSTGCGTTTSCATSTACCSRTRW
jgi:hypothetical protein